MLGSASDDRVDLAARPFRVLVAVHGHEPPSFAPHVCSVVAAWSRPSVRVLAVLEVPSPPLTSLGPPARAAYALARSRWTELEQLRLQPSLEVLGAGLTEAEVCRVTAAGGDLARAIADAARSWPADIVVVGRPAQPWRGLGRVPERLVRLAPCTVVVATPPAPPPRQSRGAAGVPGLVGQGA